MKKFFLTGIVLQVFLLFGHLYNNRHGLPIPVIDEPSRMLTHLMRTYEIQYSVGKHTLDQTLAGYDWTWAILALFTIVASILVVRKPENIQKGRQFTSIGSFLWLLCLVAALLYWSPKQQILFGLLFLSFLASYFLEWRLPKPKDKRICIVGGGISGLTAAYELHKKGYSNITVLEKAAQIGGKCTTNLLKWHPFDLGGHEMLAGYTDVVQMATELGAPTRKSIPPLVYNHDTQKYLDFKKAALISGQFTLLQVMIASFKYLYWVGTRYRHFSKPATGFQNMPADLAEPLGDWLEHKNLVALSDILSFVIKVQGYGDFKETPAAYLVKFMGFKNWLSLLLSGIGIYKKWPRVLTYGMQNLCNRIAATIPDVRVNINILKIERDANKVQNGVKIYTDSQSEPLIFDQLIVSTPMQRANLSFLELTATEKSLFEQVKVTRFATTLCEIQGLPAGVVANIPLNAVGDFTGYIKDFEDMPIAMFFSVLEGKITGKIVEDKIQTILNTMPPYDNQQPKVLRFLEQKIWNYFPHVNQASLKAGFYNDLEGIQGQNQTYFASSLLAFECVGNCVAYSKRLITKHF